MGTFGPLGCGSLRRRRAGAGPAAAGRDSLAGRLVLAGVPPALRSGCPAV
jgi:hypothetical protein